MYHYIPPKVLGVRPRRPSFMKALTVLGLSVDGDFVDGDFVDHCGKVWKQVVSLA
jgi:hypothetical protein